MLNSTSSKISSLFAPSSELAACDIICISGPGNVHFDYGQDIYFIKREKEHPAQGGKAKDAERRLVIFGVHFLR